MMKVHDYYTIDRSGFRTSPVFHSAEEADGWKEKWDQYHVDAHPIGEEIPKISETISVELDQAIWNYGWA